MKTVQWIIFGFLGLTLVAAAACSNKQAQTDLSSASPGHATHTAAATAGHVQVVELAVTSAGFIPASFKVHAGHPVKLIVTRKVDRTCATEIVIKAFEIKKPLPLNAPIEVAFTPKQPGKIRFACAMDMIAGEIVVE